MKQITPRCQVFSNTGEEWSTNNSSYSSYNVSYEPQADLVGTLRGLPFPLEVRVGMGINLWYGLLVCPQGFILVLVA